jgi:hypothetical protein
MGREKCFDLISREKAETNRILKNNIVAIQQSRAKHVVWDCEMQSLCGKYADILFRIYHIKIF